MKCQLDCLRCGRCNQGQREILDSFLATDIDVQFRDGFGIACDLGTTGVVLALINLSDGTVVGRHSFPNPQRIFGPDVLSRIHAAEHGQGPSLQRLICQNLENAVDELLTARGCSGDKVTHMVIAGNTTMIYLLLGFPVESLARFPFRPAVELSPPYDYTGLLGMALPHCKVDIVPWLAAFVGGDITAGLLCLPKKPRCLLMDLGTNGEMVLYDNSKLTVASTAAGPAFEGGGHSGGASAVLEDLTTLRRGGFLDETGRLAENAPPLFTQKEIRELQSAKSALRTGLELLIADGNLTAGDIDRLYLAGGLGQAMDAAAAAELGIIPRELVGKTVAAGNTSLGGGVMLLLSPALMEEAVLYQNTAKELNLAACPRFNELFAAYMCFEAL